MNARPQPLESCYLRMIFAENRGPFFGIMRYSITASLVVALPTRRSRYSK
jgi:hypothetical protein